MNFIKFLLVISIILIYSFTQDNKNEIYEQLLNQYHGELYVNYIQHPEKYKWINNSTEFIVVYSKFDYNEFNLINGKIYSKSFSTAWKNYDKKLQDYFSYYCDAKIVFRGQTFIEQYFYEGYLIEVHWKQCLIDTIIVKDRSEFHYKVIK